MQRWIGRLQWRLTLSYILVTTVGMVTLVVAIVALTAVTLRPKSGGGVYKDKGIIQSMAYDIAPYLAPYLEQSKPDVADLTLRLNNVLQPISKKRLPDYAAPYTRPNALIVLDSNDRPLAVAGTAIASAPTTPAPTDTPSFAAQLPTLLGDSQVQSAMRDAETGDQTSESLVAHLPNSQMLVASPLITFNGQVIGVVLGIFPDESVQLAADLAQQNQLNAITSVLGQIIPGATIFLLGASVLGILTGFLFARGLSRRLKHITSAAHDWSRGAFQVMVQDRVHDEIGQLAQDLNAMAGQLQRLVFARQELAVVEERHRLASDLHDSIKQQLFVITMLIGTARVQGHTQPDVAQTLDEAEKIATQTHQELTALIRALRPVALVGKPFGTLLRDLVASWSRSTGIGAVLYAPEVLVMDPAMQKALFLVTQEALANIARHSGATSVTLDLAAEADVLELTISDDGHGFDPDQVGQAGLGLISMRERLAAIGGTLHVTSGAGGTCIHARCTMVPASEIRAGEAMREVETGA